MFVLGIESSCDETGVALYDSNTGLLAHALHSQIETHRIYGGWYLNSLHVITSIT